MKTLHNVAIAGSKNCKLVLHIGTKARYFGSGWDNGARVEILTPEVRLGLSLPTRNAEGNPFPTYLRWWRNGRFYAQLGWFKRHDGHREPLWKCKLAGKPPVS